VLRKLNRELARWMLDRRMLTEDNLILMAQKTLAHKPEYESPAISAAASSKGRLGSRAGA